MASSAQNHHHHFSTANAATAAPPPTPSSAQPASASDTSAATDLLSRLLHRLPPTLSNTPIPRRRAPPASAPTTTTPPVIPFPDLNSSLSSTLPSVSQLGFFQLTNHPIPSQLARSAESDSLSIFNLPHHYKRLHFPRSWPLGFDEDDEDAGDTGESLFLDLACATESPELSLGCLREFTREMEKVGLAVMEALSCALGLENPTRDDPTRVCSLMWISDGSVSPGDKMTGSGKFYPYIVGLNYQIRSQNCSLLTDSGLVSVSSQMDSILVTIGDIAQVWSNGKLKKARGKPVLGVEENVSSALSMFLLVTLPLESTVSPLLPRVVIGGFDNHSHREVKDHDEDNDKNKGGEESLFNSFSFEDYAWKVYHERIHLKDPLDRYCI